MLQCMGSQRVGHNSATEQQLTSIPDYGKTIALIVWTFVGKVMSLRLNVLSRFAIGFPFKEQVSFNIRAAVTIHSHFGAHRIKSITASTFPLLFAIKSRYLMSWPYILECWVSSQLFTLLFHPHQGTVYFLSTFCHLSNIIWISGAVDICPSNLEYNLWFVQPGILHEVLCI